MSEIQLSTMTLDGKIKNIKFDKKTAIHGLNTHENIIKIGCNYGMHISDIYHEKYSKEKPKTNRGRKPKKVETHRKKQGNGSHFNSQITFTILNPINDMIYQVKLFTNGRLQIPGIGNIQYADQYTEIMDSVIYSLLSYININRTLKFHKDQDVILEYLSPILQNYKFKIDLEENIEFLDLYSLKKLFFVVKSNRDTSIKIHSIIFHPERYAGLLIKFSTPDPVTESHSLNKLIEMVRLYTFKKSSKRKIIYTCNMTEEEIETYPKIHRIVQLLHSYWKENNKVRKKVKSKQTTVKIFKSGKINIDSANSVNEADTIRSIIINEIDKKKEDIIYRIPSMISLDLKDKVNKNITKG